jgi:hypothetical protein
MTPLPLLCALVSVSQAAPLDPAAYGSLAASFAPGSAVTVNSTTGQMSGGASFTGLVVGSTVVFTFDSVNVTQPITITGTRSVAFLSKGTLTVNAAITAVGSGVTAGAGGDDGGNFDGDSGSGPGGGSGYYGGAGGGFGGRGGDAGYAAGGAVFGDLATALDGGSGGGRSAYSGSGNGGGGGGAIELGSLGALNLGASALLDVRGRAGADDSVDGGGGGAGGGILVHGVGGTCSGQLLADGGRGGDGLFYSFGGGGGGGGRITVLGLSAVTCTRSVSAGRGGLGVYYYYLYAPWDGAPGSPGVSILDLDGDADGWTVGELDCNDANATINPGAAEVVGDNVDQSCNGVEDCFVDADNDGARTLVTDPGGTNGDGDCNDANEGLAADLVDCNDGSSAIRPGASEVTADGVDQNCDGVEDCWTDADNDGARVAVVDPGGANGDADCNDANEALGTDPLDCADTDASRSPAAGELPGDNVDQNCDSVENCYVDADNDGGRTTTVQTGGTNNDADCNDPNEALAAELLDCNDASAAIGPLAAEVPGDNTDQNCDGLEDCYVDADNDGARTAAVDPGGSTTDADCNDANEAVAADLLDCNDASAAISPAASEVVADGVDQNCDGVEDCYTDADDDGGRTGVIQPGGANNDADCNDPAEGVTSDPADCDDAVFARGPFAIEGVGDNVDQNCDGREDCFVDADDDGARTTVVDAGGTNDDADCNDAREGLAGDLLDCDDTASGVGPNAAEVPGDGIDQDCDGVEDCFVDDDDDGALGVGVLAGGTNNDADCGDPGEGSAGDPVDCADGNAARAPGNPEIGCSGVDEDCSATTPDLGDEDLDGAQCDVDCDDGDASVLPGGTEVACNGVDDDCDTLTPDGVDSDLDGASVCGGDCDDADDTVFPGADELACDGIDNDCEPLTVDDPDLDEDGLYACSGDCDDLDPAVPGPTELECNGADDDCDPLTPDGPDLDGDGTSGCGGDCDDNDPTSFPGAPEVYCDGIDQDCDGDADPDPDDDSDGWTICAGDCDDGDAEVFPAAAEEPCNGIDDDCDPGTLDDPGTCAPPHTGDSGDTGETGVIVETGVPLDTGESGDTGATGHTGGDTGSPPTDSAPPPGGTVPVADPGCGCGTTTGRSASWLVGAGLLALRRRRSRASGV